MKNSYFILLLLLAMLLTFGGCGGAGRSATPSASVGAQSQTGNLWDPDRKLDAKTIAAIPYSYTGRSLNWEVRCNVRSATDEERTALLERSKSNRLANESAYQQHTISREEYESKEKMYQAYESELSGGQIYISELFAAYIGESAFMTDSIHFELRSGDTKLISNTLAVEGAQDNHVTGKAAWFLSENTPNSFTTGLLLPKEKSYTLTVTMGLESEQIELNRV